MLRKLFNTCTFFSMLLCAGTVWWWTSRSATHIDQVSFQSNGCDVMRVSASDGKFMFDRTVRSIPGLSNSKQLAWGSAPSDSNVKAASLEHGPAMNWTGFAYSSDPIPAKAGGGMETTAVIPAWLMVAAFGFLPLMWVTAKIKRHPKKKPAAS